MKFTMIVRDYLGHEIRETYDKPIGRATEGWDEYHPRNRLRGQTLKAVEEWCRALIDWYNATLRPHEHPREFVSCEIPVQPCTEKEAIEKR